MMNYSLEEIVENESPPVEIPPFPEERSEMLLERRRLVVGFLIEIDTKRFFIAANFQSNTSSHHSKKAKTGKEVLFTAISIFDRSLPKIWARHNNAENEPKVKELCIFGLCSYIIAFRFHDTFDLDPLLSDWSYACSSKTVTEKQLKDGIVDVLQMVEWRISQITTIEILEMGFFSLPSSVPPTLVRHLALLTFFDIRLENIKRSVLAALCVALALKLKDQPMPALLRTIDTTTTEFQYGIELLEKLYRDDLACGSDVSLVRKYHPFSLEKDV